MKIYTVTGDYMKDVESLFPQHSVEILPDDYSKIIADLVVFTGGEDISPSFYGSNKKIKWANLKRDEWELAVFKNILRGRLRTTKTLGICRGLQLMNVGFGGTLIHDILSSYGISHGNPHPINWSTETPMAEFLPVVNSLHHQGINNIGEMAPFKILGTEPKTGVIEAIMWSDNFLAFQFHPEFFPECPVKEKLSELICDWIKGKKQMYSSRIRSRAKLGTFSYSNLQELPTGEDQ